MHPASSIILFTTLSGPGLGLAAIIGLGSFGGAEYIRLWAAAVAIGFTTMGLISSIFHLRRPDRAWRAFSQWESSWLSREGILAPTALGLLVIYVGIATVMGTAPPVIGWITAGICGFTVFATAMIYAQLKPVAAWYTPLTPALYLAYATTGGILLAATLATAGSTADTVLLAVATGAILIAWLIQLWWWWRLDAIGTGDTTKASAVGAEGGKSVRLLQPPHTMSNYLMNEMVYVVARKHAYRLRTIALVFGGIIPTALLAVAIIGDGSFAVVLLAALSHLLGTGVSRWLFFAEARHTVSHYY